MRFSRSLVPPLLFLLALPAIAQGVRPFSAVPDTYGTASITFLPLDAFNFVPIDSTLTYNWTNTWGFYRTNSSGSQSFRAGLQFPEGAGVQYLELNVCDSDAAGQFNASIFSVDQSGVPTTLANFPNATTIAETPGCVLRGFTFPAFTVDNASHVYYLDVQSTDVGSGLILVGARVGYRLQVSQPPVTPTFVDVPPTHPFYQYIEALAASGITAGCGNGQYCPDLALTRGQMAVFLAKALGLHWTP